MRLPKRIVLPFGYRIRVRFVSNKEMEELAGELLDGYWTPESKGGGEILIRRSLRVTRKRYILGHELQHAVNDFVHEFLNEGSAKA